MFNVNIRQFQTWFMQNILCKKCVPTYVVIYMILLITEIMIVVLMVIYFLIFILAILSKSKGTTWCESHQE